MASEAHQLPVEGSSCKCCWDDIDSSTYVEYKSSESSAWLPSGFCCNCVNHLISSQWELYTNALAKTTCKAEQRRLLTTGPPINVKDHSALECPDGGEVYSLWYMSDGEVHSAKLVGSLTGEERTKYWEEQKAFYIQDEPEEEKAEDRVGEGKAAAEAK